MIIESLEIKNFKKEVKDFSSPFWTTFRKMVREASDEFLEEALNDNTELRYSKKDKKIMWRIKQ